MADNVTINGVTYATEDIGGVHHMRIRMSYGTNGTVTPVGPNTPMPVTDQAIGSPVANPDPFSALGRLKDIQASLVAQLGFTDGIEALIASTNSYVDTLEALVATSNTNLAAINASTDTVETLMGTSNAALAALNTYVDGLEGLLAKGPQTAALSLSTTPSTDQDPVFDHTVGVKVVVDTTATAGGTTILTVPAGCKFIRISADADVFIRTDRTVETNAAGGAVADDGKAIKLYANQPEILPVVAGQFVRGITAAGSSTVRAMPMKVR